MTAKIFKHIPTRAEWQTARNAAGGKKGLVSGVSVGDLLDGLKNAGKDPSKRQTAWNKLITGLEKYKSTKAVVSLSDLNATVTSILAHATACQKAEVKLGKMVADMAVLYRNLMNYAEVPKEDVTAKEAEEAWKDCNKIMELGRTLDAALLKFGLTISSQQWEIDEMPKIKGEPFNLESQYWRKRIQVQAKERLETHVQIEMKNAIKKLAAMGIVINAEPEKW